MSHLENISFEISLFIYVLWTNKCQEMILKILPLPSQEPFVFTVSCRLRDVEKVCWFGYLKLTCLCAENMHPFSPQMSSKQ